jgi:NADPH:quinone reductase-like Zn-dependent oxidoreductase
LAQYQYKLLKILLKKEDLKFWIPYVPFLKQPLRRTKKATNIMTNTVIITGASQGIGKATALLFARHNYNVVLAARQLDRLEATAAQIRELGQEAIATAFRRLFGMEERK